MRIAIWPGAGQPWAEVLEVARHAAETGWDGVYIADHFMPNAGTGRPADTPTLECGSLVAALGAAVPRVRRVSTAGSADVVSACRSTTQ